MNWIFFKNVLRACRGMHEAEERAREVNVANGGSRDELLRQDLPTLTGLRFVAAFTAVVSVAVITYLNYGAVSCTNIVCKMNMNFALAPTAALLVFCGARYKNIGSRVLALRPVLLLGGASYSIYLVHDVVLGAAVKLTGSAKHSFVFGETGASPRGRFGDFTGSLHLLRGSSPQMASKVAPGNAGFVCCASGRLLKQDASSVSR